MNKLKQAIAVLMAVVLLMPATVFAADSPTLTSIREAEFDIPTLVYNGKTQTVKYTITYDGKTLVEGKDFKIDSGKSAKNVGSYKLRIIGIGKFTDAYRVQYNVISQKEAQGKLAGATVISKALFYNGKEQKPTIKVTVGGKTLKEGTDYTIQSTEQIKNTNTYSVNVVGKGAYANSVYTTKVIVQKAYQDFPALNNKKVKAGKTIKLGVKGNAKTTVKCSKSVFAVKKNKLTVKKGAKPGKYAVTIVTKKTKNYRKAKKTIYIVVQ